MVYRVFLTDDAVVDLEELHDYLQHHGPPVSADHVLEQIERALDSLSENQRRGAYPRELLAIGMREYREIVFKPYRIIYRHTRLQDPACLTLDSVVTPRQNRKHRCSLSPDDAVAVNR